MESVYHRLRTHARHLVARAVQPRFYTDYARAVASSQQFLESDPTITDLCRYIHDRITDDFGHGPKHALKVTLDAGALMIIEGRRAAYAPDVAERRLRLVQCAGLLHDVARKHRDHARKSASLAAGLLQQYPFAPDEIHDVCRAIRNHEAFKKTETAPSPEGQLLSHCLYDADKFRWGPDNFTDTVWAMVTYHQTPLPQFFRLYPRGMESLERIKGTFRTHTGRRYGPQFIDISLTVGRQLHQLIETEFTELL